MTPIELVERVEQTYQRLQQFQERYAAQLSHTDRQWLHQTLDEVACYHAELSSLWGTRSMAPERQGIAPRWRKMLWRTLQRQAQQGRATVQQARDTAAAVRSMARAARRRCVRQGLVPLCAFCKQIRDEHGTWQRLEAYLQAHFAVQFTHDFCLHCTQRHYGITLPNEASKASA